MSFKNPDKLKKKKTAKHVVANPKAAAKKVTEKKPPKK